MQDVAYALVRAVSRLFSTLFPAPQDSVGMSADAARTSAYATVLLAKVTE